MPTATSTPQGTTITSHIAGFTLANLTVRVEDTVRWVNDDGANHTTTSGQNGTFAGNGWNSPFLSQGQSFSHTFTALGTFPYTCRVHSFMNATVTVQAQ